MGVRCDVLSNAVSISSSSSFVVPCNKCDCGLRPGAGLLLFSFSSVLRLRFLCKRCESFICDKKTFCFIIHAGSETYALVDVFLLVCLFTHV